MPITVEDGGRRLHIFADLGTGPYRFLLDTGATDMTVTESVAAELLRGSKAVEGPIGEVTLADGSVREELQQ